MSRTRNSNNIEFGHLSWKDDHLCVMFDNKRITNPARKPEKLRRVFANPKMPEICPILALGIYLLSIEQDAKRLFPPPPLHKNERHKTVDLTKTRELVAKELQAKGIRTSTLGSDSIQKGAVVYCVS
ncbi:hypothetical protein GUITHDRAFT_73929, partial [Guillardia theta CCMP2712]